MKIYNNDQQILFIYAFYKYVLIDYREGNGDCEPVLDIFMSDVKFIPSSDI
jgi:hypothetical protein